MTRSRINADKQQAGLPSLADESHMSISERFIYQFEMGE